MPNKQRKEREEEGEKERKKKHFFISYQNTPNIKSIITPTGFFSIDTFVFLAFKSTMILLDRMIYIFFCSQINKLIAVLSL